MQNESANTQLSPEALRLLRHIYDVVGNAHAVDENPALALEALLKEIEGRIPTATHAILAGMLRSACGIAGFREFLRRKKEHTNRAA